jgi:hypothetical protein
MPPSSSASPRYSKRPRRVCRQMQAMPTVARARSTTRPRAPSLDTQLSAAGSMAEWAPSATLRATPCQVPPPPSALASALMPAGLSAGASRSDPCLRALVPAQREGPITAQRATGGRPSAPRSGLRARREGGPLRLSGRERACLASRTVANRPRKVSQRLRLKLGRIFTRARAGVTRLRIPGRPTCLFQRNPPQSPLLA